MTKSIVILLLITIAIVMSYQIGKTNCKTETIIKEKKVIEYVTQQKAQIYARPNADRDALLKLMQNGDL